MWYCLAVTLWKFQYYLMSGKVHSFTWEQLPESVSNVWYELWKCVYSCLVITYGQAILMRMYKLCTSWLISINAISKSLPVVNLTPVNFLKYIFEKRVNRKFNFRRDWNFCWDWGNVISGGNWLSRWECVFSSGTLYPSANYENDPWKF